MHSNGNSIFTISIYYVRNQVLMYEHKHERSNHLLEDLKIFATCLHLAFFYQHDHLIYLKSSMSVGISINNYSRNTLIDFEKKLNYS